MAVANIAELVIREVTPAITIFSKPFSFIGFLHLGGRSVAVKLTSGDVWVMASTPLTLDTKDTIDKMGPLKWIVASNASHHLYLGQFKEAYPEAKVIGVKGLVEKKKKEGMTLDGAYGVDAPETKYGFEEEISACYFSGQKNEDVAFFHVASKTLMQADLLFNLPCTEQYSKTSWSGRVPIIGNINPTTGLHSFFVNRLGQDQAAMARDAKTVLDWAPERIIPSHGVM
ncbi:hypothetical protein C8F01DRAFT_488762 [Mycena amicta]|nr:hypothetical protein C8F01DRAFT_488762 [Mycena amicta]